MSCAFLNLLVAVARHNFDVEGEQSPCWISFTLFNISLPLGEQFVKVIRQVDIFHENYTQLQGFCYSIKNLFENE